MALQGEDSKEAESFRDDESEVHDPAAAKSENSFQESEPSDKTPERDPTHEEKRMALVQDSLRTIFRASKLKLTCPPRWTGLFLNAAEQFERRMDGKREALFMAVALDDAEILSRMRKEMPEELWTWWAYDLELVWRASNRCRPKLLEAMPELFGQCYPGVKAVTELRQAMDHVPEQGSAESILEKQRSEVLCGIVKSAMLANSEIDVPAIREQLELPISGPWQTDRVPAVGVNYGTRHGDYAGWRVLHFIAANNHARRTAVEAAKLLFDAKADATLADGSGSTPLHVAAYQGNSLVIDVLLEYGAPLDVPDNYGATPLIAAAKARHAGLMRSMVNWMLPDDKAREGIFKTDAERESQHYNFAAGVRLHVDVAEGNVEQVVRLVTAEVPDCANVNFADPMGRRPVHTAVSRMGNDRAAADMLRTLVALKADINARDKLGQTPLHLAAFKGRALVAKMCLLLKAHPSLPDKSGSTPLMLSVAGPTELRKPPAYNGVEVNRALRWNSVQDILDWNGRGDPPIRDGPRLRKTAAPEEQSRPASSKSARSKRSLSSLEDDEDEDEDEEEEEEEEEDDEEEGYFTLNDAIIARANTLAEMGFDDQRIIGDDGRVNRGDRLQLFTVLFQRDRFFEGAPGEMPPIIPHDVRCRIIWKNLVGPMLTMQQQKILPPRPSEFLHYLLLVMLGPKGPTFGTLIVNGTGGQVMPPWTAIEEALRADTLESRATQIRTLGFRGPKPKRQLWVGSVWEQGKYPREPMHAPWKALYYVDRENADVLNQKDPINPKPNLSDEAFKGNIMPLFEAAADGSAHLPHRGDQLQLANRLFVNEAIATRSQVEDRARLVGEKLLCPLLMKTIARMKAVVLGKTLKKRDSYAQMASERELLEYLGMQTKQPEDCYVFANDPKRPFKHVYDPVVEEALELLSTKAPEQLTKIPFTPGFSTMPLSMSFGLPPMRKKKAEPEKPKVTLGRKRSKSSSPKRGSMMPDKRRTSLVEYAPAAENDLDEILRDAPPGDYEQFKLLTADDRRWLVKGHSTKAFVALRRCSALINTEDLVGVISDLGGGTQDFGGRFWRAVWRLFLWGRAHQLQPVFEAELARRMPDRGARLHRMRLQERSDLLKLEEVPTPAEKPSSSSGRPGSRPSRRKAKLDRTAGLPDSNVGLTGVALYTGNTDMLRAEIICEDADSLLAAYDAICGPPTRDVPQQVKPGVMIMNEREGFAGFRPVRMINGFSEDQRDKVLALAAGVIIVVNVGWRPRGYGAPVEQLVEVELMLHSALDARWLANFMKLGPEDLPPPPPVEDWNPAGLLSPKSSSPMSPKSNPGSPKSKRPLR